MRSISTSIPHTCWSARTVELGVDPGHIFRRLLVELTRRRVPNCASDPSSRQYSNNMMSGYSGTLYIRLAVEPNRRNRVRRPQAGQISAKAVLRQLGLSQDANISRAEKDISVTIIASYVTGYAELLYQKILDADIPAASSNTIKTLGYRNFCKESFRSYRKWGNVPVAIQVRMCEYLEMEFPVLSMARNQWASVAFFSAYFRRGFNVPIDNNCPSSQKVPIFDREEQYCEVPAETDDADFTADSSEPVQPPAPTASSGDKRKISETHQGVKSAYASNRGKQEKNKAGKFGKSA
ncbi:hypothetical protein V1521DRAFT_417519 [Lipomyces starkeyi]